MPTSNAQGAPRVDSLTHASIPPFEEQTAGNLAVRLATTPQEVDAAQALRYRVFHEEMGATAEGADTARRDVDEYDAVCDHLLVLDYDRPDKESQVVGTYRLLRREAMQQIGRFYSESEFNIDAIKRHPGEILELGRSCVDKDYRNRVVMQLLWRGIGVYVDRYRIKMMFGCASLTGTDPKAHAQPLSYLYHFHLAPPAFQPQALPERYVEMNMIPKEKVNEKAAFAALPPLIKGYLRAGGQVGKGAVVDYDYNTTDVGIVVEIKQVTDKYVQRYSPNPAAIRE